MPVLFYHHIEDLAKADSEGHKWESVAPEIFEQQMQYLSSNGYRIIKAEELVNALINHQQLGKVAIVSIDDGYDDLFGNAFQIARRYGVTISAMIATGLLENPGYMTWEQLREMVSAGNAAYDHTWSHFNLPSGDSAKVTSEINLAKQQLDDHVGKTFSLLTYPYGTTNNNVIGILRSNGFVAAFTTLPGTLQCDSFIMALHRTRIGNASLSYYGL